MELTLLLPHGLYLVNPAIQSVGVGLGQFLQRCLPILKLPHVVGDDQRCSVCIGQSLLHGLLPLGHALEVDFRLLIMGLDRAVQSCLLTLYLEHVLADGLALSQGLG